MDVKTVNVPELYMLTDRNSFSNGFRWASGRTHSWKDTRLLMSSKWMSMDQLGDIYKNKTNQKNKLLIAHTHPVIALLMNRVTYDVDDPILWECSGDVDSITPDRVAHCKTLQTKEEGLLPVINPLTRIRFGFGCVTKVYKDEEYNEWILDWFGSKDMLFKRGKEIMEKCIKTVQETVKQKGEDCPEAIAGFAAQWMCCATTAYQDWMYRDGMTKTIEMWTAKAAQESFLAAQKMKLDNFDLVRIAEVSMAARD